MAKKHNQFDDYAYLRQRSRRSLVGATVSMGLVLFFLGLFVSSAWLATEGSRELMRAQPVKMFLSDRIDSTKLTELQQAVSQASFYASHEHVTKDMALKRMQERTGEDVLAITEGINPLPASIEVQLKDEYLSPEKVQPIIKELQNYPMVTDVSYSLEDLAEAKENQPAVLLGAGLLCLLTCLIVGYLIFGAIRGTIYAQRLNIRTMQLIGATKGFIRRPFVFRGFMQGFFAGVLAGILLLAFLSLLRFIFLDIFPESVEPLLPGLVAILGGIVLLGSLLGFAGSGMAVNRFLDQDLADLMK
ncbi:MAG: cell division protein FtsX [Bacteroidia bacterium]